MTSNPTPCRLVRLLTLSLALSGLAGLAQASDSYDPTSRQLTAQTVTVGALTLTDMVVTIGGIVSGPSGSAPSAATDSYAPATSQLTVPAVTVGSARYYNVVATVSGLKSVASVAGGDTYDGSTLTVASIQVGGTVYTDVKVTVASVLSPGGGMPRSTSDSYDVATGELTLVAVQAGAKVYTNPVVRIGSILSIGSTQSATPNTDLQAFASVFVALQFTNGLVDLAGIAAHTIPCVSGSSSLDATTVAATYSACTTADLPGNSYSGTVTGTNAILAGAGYLQVEPGAMVTITQTSPVSFSATTGLGGFYQDESVAANTISGAFGSASMSFRAGKTSNYTLTSPTISQLSRTPLGGVFTTDIPSFLGGVGFNNNATLETETTGSIIWQESGYPTTGSFLAVAANGKLELTVQFLSGGQISLSDPVTGYSATKNWTDADVQAALAYVTE